MPKFQLESFHRNIPDPELVEELLRCHAELKRIGESLTYRSYSKVGKYSSSIFSNRFGSWNDALKAAGIEPNETKGIDAIELFGNLEDVWENKGKQPVYRDMSVAPSKDSASTYCDRFGSWRKALEAFIAYINEDDREEECAEAVDVTKKVKPKNEENKSSYQ